MIPESVIVGEWLPDITTPQRVTAFLLYSYLDLRQGEAGWPVKGFRAVAKAIGLQERTVAAAARNLAKAGLIELTYTKPVATKAVMKVIHNPARGKVNPAAAIGLPAKRYRHGTLTYRGGDRVQGPHNSVQHVHTRPATPDARRATGSRSMRSEWFDAPTRRALA